MDIVYLQVDSRYNRWLFQKIDGMSVLEHTLNKIEKLSCDKVVAGIYNCAENDLLIKTLENKGKINVIQSEDGNVNSRFVNLMVEESAGYILRVGGDQIFLDVEETLNVLKEMKLQNKEFFYHDGLSSVLPDIVSVKCLRSRKEHLLQKDRYFMVLDSDESVERFRINDFCTLLYDFRVNSSMSYRICKRIIEREMNIYKLSLYLSNLLRDKNNYLNQTGLLGSWIYGNSYEDFYWDETEKVNPWWGKTIIDLICKRLNKKMRVFEWGMGNSTLFWSQYVAEVVSVESDREWYQKMNTIVQGNAFPRYCKLEYDGEYCRAILNEQGKFDIILIDGRDRVRCAYNSLEKLKENGVIIWDNSERKYYQEGYDFLKEYGFKQLELCSVIYGNPGVGDYTSIFYKEDNVLGL